MAPLFLNVKSTMAETNAIEFKNGCYLINYRLTPLDKIFKEIENEFKITITGLNRRRSENISLSITDESVEGILKKMIKSIGKESYAFVYIFEKLTRVYFVPDSGAHFIPSEEKKTIDIKKKSDLGARVTSVFYDSSTPSSELKIGDVIIEYDNIRITRGPIELSELMKERSELDSIEMRILRDHVPMSIFVPGGFINAGLKTIALDETDF